jgi:hypothetical protein
LFGVLATNTRHNKKKKKQKKKKKKKKKKQKQRKEKTTLCFEKLLMGAKFCPMIRMDS